ncbi:putative Mitotic spindle-associated MMXD complex subunit MIP18 protein [Naja naja]|nr:putative Mitotic spindle-associated MMXD complex subunit MIP18 protein [Naja naja]
MVGPLGGGGGGGLENANPLVYRRQGERPTTAREQDEGLPDAIDDREIFDILWRGPGRGERRRERRVGGVHAHHPALQHGHPHRPLHQSEANPVPPGEVQVNKQLADKERVAAALENMHLLQVVNQCLSGRS